MNTQPSRLTIAEVTPRTLSASGIIDAHTADTFTEHIERLGCAEDIEVHLAGVEFVDSSGLRAIIAAHQTLAGAGNKLVLTDLSEAVSRLVQITGLDQHLNTM